MKLGKTVGIGLFGLALVLMLIFPVIALGIVGAISGGGTGCDSSSSSGPQIAAGGDATNYAKSRKGQVSYAVATPDGNIVASYQPSVTTNGASMTKAMILVGRLRELGNKPIPDSEKPLMEAMIQQSDNNAANQLFSITGRGGVEDVANAVGMKNFSLDTSDPVYVLGNSKVAAGDQAKFFARIDQLIPQQNRNYALNLMANLQEGRWGLVEADLPGQLYSKAGWRPEANGSWTVTQGAQYGNQNRKGIAVLTQGDPDENYGHDTIKGVAQRINFGSLGNTNRQDCGTSTSVSGVRGKIVETAKSQIGTSEQPPGSNNVPKYNVNGVAWCTLFVSWVWKQAGVQMPTYAYCGDVGRWAQANTTWKQGAGNNPQPGDAVLYATSFDSCDHIGIVIDVDQQGHITTVEGNLGDQVSKRGPFDPKSQQSPNSIFGYASPEK